MEIWKDIPGYEGLYEASSSGRIRSKEGKTTSSKRFEKRVWKQRIMKQKYKTLKSRKDLMVTLWKDGKPYYHLVARLIATTFHENYLRTKFTVNHKDGNPLNNNESNLEWLTGAENLRYGFENGQFSFCKPVEAVSDDGETLIARSRAELDRKLGQYRGYTSRMIKTVNSEFLYNKAGKKYKLKF